MSNKRQREQQDQRPRRRRQKHLYLVLDDWKDGLSFHKIDADTFSSDTSDSDTAARAEAPEPLPEPALLRLESPPGVEADVPMFFSALGAKLFVLMNQRCALVYDTATGVLSLGPHAPAGMLCGIGVTVAVGPTLYVLSHNLWAEQQQQQHHCFQALSWGPTAPDVTGRPTEGWSWTALPPPPPPPFAPDHRVVSYALHPDGRTIFVTPAHRGTPGHPDPVGTYAFDTERSEWRCHGAQPLPFDGQAHFDAELDGWVGLTKDGHLCCCQVASRDSEMAPFTWQTTREEVFNKHSHASLTYMGNSKFCLVKRQPHRRLDLLHISVFGLKYNHEGELRTTNRRYTRTYMVARHRYYFTPVAFWM